MMKPFLIILIIMALSTTIVHAQGCCGVGSLLVAGGHPTLISGTFFVQAGTEFSSALNPVRYRGAGSLNVAYGITDRLALSIKTSYIRLYSYEYNDAVIRNNVVRAPASTTVFDNIDFGDGLAAAQFSIIPMDVITEQELKIGIDLGIPWGPDQKKMNNATLPKKSQTGSGAFNAGSFLSYSKSFTAQKLAASSTIAGRYTFKNRRGEDPGDEASIVVSAIAGPYWQMRGSVSVSCKAVSATVDNFGTVEPSTGGSRVDIAPGIEYAFNEQIKATTSVELPLWRDAYQQRLGNNVGARLSFLYFIPVFETEK